MRIKNFLITIKRKVELWNNLTNQNIDINQWLDWKWQFKSRVKDVKTLFKILNFDSITQKKIEEVSNTFIFSVTPFQLIRVYELLQLNKISEAESLSKVFVPDILELTLKNDGVIDGLGEEDTTPFPYISQLYPDRVLLFVTDICPFYCRYCFRRRKVIHQVDLKERPMNILDDANLETAIEYIDSNNQIRDVILSGGDPLSLNDNNLEKILSRLKKIKHVEIIRIDSKIPAVMPQRITNDLIKILNKYQPIFMTLHFVHPSELEDEVKYACSKLVNSGISLGTYTPILKGVNNSREVLKSLFWELLKIKIRPYYLVHFVPTQWTEHFRVSLEESLKLISGIHYELSGLAIPSFKLYIPGKGKILLTPNSVEGPFLKGSKKIYKLTVPLGDGKINDYLFEEPLE
jgi:lysine 2,3-aminomutase